MCQLSVYLWLQIGSNIRLQITVISTGSNTGAGMSGPETVQASLLCRGEKGIEKQVRGK